MFNYTGTYRVGNAEICLKKKKNYKIDLYVGKQKILHKTIIKFGPVYNEIRLKTK